MKCQYDKNYKVYFVSENVHDILGACAVDEDVDDCCVCEVAGCAAAAAGLDVVV